MIAWTGTIPTVYAFKGNLHLHCRDGVINGQQFGTTHPCLGLPGGFG